MTSASALRPTLLSLTTLCLLVGACQDPVLNLQQRDPTQPSRAAPEAPADTEAATGQSRLAGVIKDQQTGQLLNNAQIRVDAEAGKSDSAGFYQFLSLPPGEVKLIVQYPGYHPYTQTLTLVPGRQTVDVALLPLSVLPLPEPMPNPDNPLDGSPSAEPVPIILNPDGSTSTPSPVATASASPSPVPSLSPSPSPSPSPAYDPDLDRVVQADVFIKRQGDGLQLSFVLQRSNGLPVNWSWGQVRVEYYLANLDSQGEVSQFLTNGSTVLNDNGDNFVVSNLTQTAGTQVRINFTLTFPNQRQVSQELTIPVGNP